ncbi:cupin domain-containing protein [Cohnella xylanilytica]|uniref:Cupin domain-containing protein n=1 Tax=Cohnella xylanilytica TaxID=557555 RepID=A0A841U402_9BACL|nr:cupin domain-containing protein [Cohnella xylanilytica]
MAVSYMDFTSPDVQFFFDVNKNRAFTTNSRNYINSLGVQQLNTLGNASILDIFFSKGHYVEPHYHQNATELVYCVSGAVNVSFLNPFTQKLQTVVIRPGQVANVPQGWWHYEEATEDDTHLIAIFDAPTPQVILGSDILRLTPARAMAEAYCLDEAKWKEAVAPIRQTVGIGPLDDCRQSHVAGKGGSKDTRQPAPAKDSQTAASATFYGAYANSPYPGQAAPIRVPATPFAAWAGNGGPQGNDGQPGYVHAASSPYPYPPAQGYSYPSYPANVYGQQPPPPPFAQASPQLRSQPYSVPAPQSPPQSYVQSRQNRTAPFSPPYAQAYPQPQPQSQPYASPQPHPQPFAASSPQPQPQPYAIPSPQSPAQAYAGARSQPRPQPEPQRRPQARPEQPNSPHRSGDKGTSGDSRTGNKSV